MNDLGAFKRPPELVVHTTVAKQIEDNPLFCDVVWACLLDDYLDIDDDNDLGDDDSMDSDILSVSTADLIAERKRLRALKRKERRKNIMKAMALKDIPEIYDVEELEEGENDSSQQKNESVYRSTHGNSVINERGLFERPKSSSNHGREMYARIDPDANNARHLAFLDRVAKKRLALEATIEANETMGDFVSKGSMPSTNRSFPPAPAAEELYTNNNGVLYDDSRINALDIYDNEKNNTGHSRSGRLAGEHMRYRTNFERGRPPKQNNEPTGSTSQSPRRHSRQIEETESLSNSDIYGSGSWNRYFGGSTVQEEPSTMSARKRVKELNQRREAAAKKDPPSNPLRDDRREEEENIWALEESKRSELDDIRRKKLDRKEALMRIRAIKDKIVQMEH